MTIAGSFASPLRCPQHLMISSEEANVVKVKSSQKLFTEDEVCRLTGICLDRLRGMARSRHLGFIARAAEAASEHAEKLLFTYSDLTILNLLHNRGGD